MTTTIEQWVQDWYGLTLHTDSDDFPLYVSTTAMIAAAHAAGFTTALDHADDILAAQLTSHRFGTVDADRAVRALYRRWCQICGQPLPDRFVFAMRDRDLTRSIAPEVAMHPECLHYSITACPMLAGRMDHYRASGHAEVFAGTGIVLGDPAGRRPGQAAEPWNAVWARDYTVITDPHAHLPAALLLPGQILRVRPIAVHGKPANPATPHHPTNTGGPA